MTVTESLFGAPFTGNVLANLGEGTGPLRVSFSRLMSSVSFDFATETAGTITLQAFLGASQVGSGNFVGVADGRGGFPIGIAALTGATFDSIVITAPARMAIDNLTVVAASPSVVPEPATTALLGGGLALLGAVKLRRRAKVAVEA